MSKGILRRKKKDYGWWKKGWHDRERKFTRQEWKCLRYKQMDRERKGDILPFAGNRKGRLVARRGGEGEKLDTGLIKPGMLIALALGKAFHLPRLLNDRAFPSLSRTLIYRYTNVNTHTLERV